MTTLRYRLIVTLVSAATLAACGKVHDKAGEKVTEKVLESAMSTDGTKAKVDLSGGQAKITSTDAQGNTSVMELGNAKISEADLGVPLYPGASPVANGANRTKTPEGSAVMAGFESKDGVDKVAGFYREHLRAKAAGKQLMDNSSSDAVMLVLADPQGNSAVQVLVNKADSGSSIQIMATQQAAKK